METPFMLVSEDIRIQSVRLALSVEVLRRSLVLFDAGGVTFRFRRSHLSVGCVHAHPVFVERVKGGSRFGIATVRLLDNSFKLLCRGTTHAQRGCGVVFRPTLGKIFPRVNLPSSKHPFLGESRFN